tara:strand:- start:9137 stop:9892 length:756 start_codon:yes stop_codon:yes gene_type:complete
MKIIAHRGASALRPENTIASFDLAIESGFKLIELDVHLTSDNIPIVMHDETVDRTTNGTGNINSLCLKDIKRLNAGYNFDSRIKYIEDIPTLSEIIARYNNSSHIFIEIKSKDKTIIPIIKDILIKHNLYNDKKHETLSLGIPGVSIISFDINQLILSKSISPNINHGYLVKIAKENDIEICKKYGFLGIFPYIKTISTKFVDLALSNNLFIGAWGVMSKNEVIIAKQLGLSGITVDNPSEVKKQLKRLEE